MREDREIDHPTRNSSAHRHWRSGDRAGKNPHRAVGKAFVRNRAPFPSSVSDSRKGVNARFARNRMIRAIRHLCLWHKLHYAVTSHGGSRTSLRASWDSLSPKRSKKHFLCDGFCPLACLAPKRLFRSRLIVAFIGSFAMPLLSVVRKCYSLPARHCPSLLPRLCRVANATFLGTALPRSKTNVFFALCRSVHRLVRVALARYACKCYSLRSPFPLR